MSSLDTSKHRRHTHTLRVRLNGGGIVHVVGLLGLRVDNVTNESDFVVVGCHWC